jgi:hypothetical protein
MVRVRRPRRSTSAADHDGLAAQFGIAQKLDGRVERIHVEMGDESRAVGQESRSAERAIVNFR